MLDRPVDPFILIGLWVVLAFVMAALPSNDNHWRRAYVLMSLGVPLLLWIAWAHGVWIALVGLVIGMSVLRWPVYFLRRWVKARLKGG